MRNPFFGLFSPFSWKFASFVRSESLFSIEATGYSPFCLAAALFLASLPSDHRKLFLVKPNLSGPLLALALSCSNLVQAQTAGELIAQGVDAQRKGNPDLAITQYTAALSKGLDARFEAIVLQNRALAWVEKLSWEKAVTDSDAALKLNSKSATAYAVRAEARKGLRETEKAILDYSEAIRLEPGDPIYLNNRGSLYDALQKWDLAFQDFDKAVKIQPRYVHALNGRGEALRNLGMGEKAMKDFDLAIELDAKSANLYNNRGLTLSSLGKHENALTDFNRAIQLRPDYAAAYNNRGLNYAAMRKYVEALADYNQAIKIEPGFPGPLNNRGMLSAQEGKLKDAIADFSQIIRLRPDNISAYNNRAAAYDKNGQPDKALTDLDTAIKLAPKEGQSFKNRAIAYVNRGRWDDAMGDFATATTLLPEDVEAWNWLARLYGSHPTASLRNGAKAVEAATKACELSQWKNADCVDTLGAAYAESGDFEKAKKYAHDAIAIEGIPAATRQRMERRLGLYEQGQAFHIPAPAPR